MIVIKKMAKLMIMTVVMTTMLFSLKLLQVLSHLLHGRSAERLHCLSIYLVLGGGLHDDDVDDDDDDDDDDDEKASSALSPPPRS